MREKILDLLKRKQDYVSGDSISHRLEITRQALWKHIQELKEMGYDIIAVPHLGYRLSSTPDKLYEFEVSHNLNTEFIGKKIFYFDSAMSTMDIAMQLGLKGLPEGTIVIAETQTRGRGRLGRGWFSPKYKGIYLSLILRPKILPTKSTILTFLAAVSILEAIKEITAVEAQIKWPNDILLYNKKLGGILTESNAEMDKVNFIVIGIGLNVNNEKKALINGATSLKEKTKSNTNRIILLQEILRRIEANYLLFQKKGATAIVEKWRQYNVTLGKRVKIYCQDTLLEGQAQDIDVDGGLILRKDSGVMEKVMAGDIVHCR